METTSKVLEGKIKKNRKTLTLTLLWVSNTWEIDYRWNRYYRKDFLISRFFSGRSLKCKIKSRRFTYLQKFNNRFACECTKSIAIEAWWIPRPINVYLIASIHNLGNVDPNWETLEKVILEVRCSNLKWCFLLFDIWTYTLSLFFIFS